MFKNEDDLKKIVSRLNIDDKPNPGHRESVRRRMLSVFDKSGEESKTESRPLWRTIMNSPTGKLAAAAVIIIAALIGIYYLGSSINGTSVVFADIVERLHNARTLTYTVNTTTEMKTAFKEPGYMRITMPGGFVTVIDWTQGKGISIIPPRTQYIEMEMSNLPHDPARQQFDAIEELRALPNSADEDLGTREIDGQMLQGFRVNKEGVINTVWLDPQTGNLVRVETEFIKAAGMNVVMTDFKFNVDLNDSFFSLTPPEGYARMEVDVDVSETTEQDLIKYLQLWASWTKDGTFPPTFNPIELQKVAMEMEKHGMFGEGTTTEQERQEHAMQMSRGMMFLLNLPEESNWRYAGEDVKLGNAEAAIFWYQPKDSEFYRVIYGDLRVRETIADNLPTDTSFAKGIDEPTQVSKPKPTISPELAALAIKLPKPMFVGTPQNVTVPHLEKPLGKPRPPFYAPVGTKNIAFGKTVSSTDEFPIIGELEWITDGDKEGADGSFVELGPFPQSITIDLETEHNIYAIVFWHYHKEARVFFDVVVQVADDPDFTTNVRTLFNNDIDNFLGLGVGKDMHYTETAEGKLIDAKGVNARYVRLHSNGSTGSDANHYIEVEVYGMAAE
jgi:outer membrane lipoprotein-sorting protein